MLHISNWPLRSYSTIKGLTCDSVNGNNEFKQPHIYKPGMK